MSRRRRPSGDRSFADPQRSGKGRSKNCRQAGPTTPRKGCQTGKPRRLTVPGAGLCLITRPGRLERARRMRPTEQFARRIRTRARPSGRPITRGTRQRTAEVVAEVVVAVEAEVVVVEVGRWRWRNGWWWRRWRRWWRRRWWRRRRGRRRPVIGGERIDQAPAEVVVRHMVDPPHCVPLPDGDVGIGRARQELLGRRDVPRRARGRPTRAGRRRRPRAGRASRCR